MTAEADMTDNRIKKLICDAQEANQAGMPNTVRRLLNELTEELGLNNSPLTYDPDERNTFGFPTGR